jgi:hypothetical protein
VTAARPNLPDRGAATVVARFADREGAKLVLERLVREVPLDRRGAVLRCGEDGASLEVTAPGADAERVADLLRRCGGQGC